MDPLDFDVAPVASMGNDVAEANFIVRRGVESTLCQGASHGCSTSSSSV